MFKLLLIGDVGVGKSSLILRFAEDTFFEATEAALGFDFVRFSFNDPRPLNVLLGFTYQPDSFRKSRRFKSRGAPSSSRFAPSTVLIAATPPVPQPPSQIWDTAGQERFRTLPVSYHRTAHATAIVFDLTDAASFNNAATWLRESVDRSGSSHRRILVGAAFKHLVARIRSDFFLQEPSLTSSAWREPAQRRPHSWNRRRCVLVGVGLGVLE